MIQPRPNTYAEADFVLGSRDSLKIANNTYLERLDDDMIAVRLHHTYVVKFTQDGRVILNSGGWQTTTTKERFNRYLPGGYRVWATKRVWHLYLNGERVGEYVDGMTIRETVEVDA